MNLYRLILRTFKHYLSNNLAAAAGIAISTAVICGAIIVGDSLKQSMLEIVEYRLGETTHTLTAGERIFTAKLAQNMERLSGYRTIPMLKSEAVLSNEGGALRLEQAQIWGTNVQAFQLEDDEASISQNVADKLGLKVGDYLYLRMKHIGPIPANTPFVSEDKLLVSKRVQVKSIASIKSYGRLSLLNSQSAPFNVFVNASWLNRVMGLKDKANILLIHAKETTASSDLEAHCRKALTLEDVNLLLKPTSNKEYVLTSERVFVDETLSTPIQQNGVNVKSYLTYFVNSLTCKDKMVPYSFVTALENTSQTLGLDETLVNAWLAQDLNIKVGDSLRMKYFVFEDLRTLTEKEAVFCVKGILPQDATRSDSALMPYMPGLSDAGNCRDWKTGIPINLKLIRDKDEAYWKTYKGTPKAYINLSTGQKLWKNRFGNTTTLVFPSDGLTLQTLSSKLAQAVNPFKTEFQIHPVLSEGLQSAKNGVDFAQLFVGLGFFIVFAGLLLTILLFNLSLKRRKEQIFVYAAMGFPNALIRKIVVSEIVGIALFGGFVGVLLSIGYSKLVFLGLQKIWFDIVRTDVLQVHINIPLLISGALMAVLIGVVTVYVGIRKTLLGQVVRRHKIQSTKRTLRAPHWFNALFLSVTLSTLIVAAFLLITKQYDSIMGWFSTGTFLLVCLMLLVYYLLHFKREHNDKTLTLWNLSLRTLRRNPSRSFAVVVLLAVGAFALGMTAANKKDKLGDGRNRASGTGGFEYIAETTIPILRDLNRKDVRTEYGLSDHLHFVQFLSTYDDNASCLNLNRIANPKILAVEPAELEGRFHFASAGALLQPDKPWQSLENEASEAIPAVADLTVIQWGLGKKIGDTLVYTNHLNEKVHVVLIGGLANSIFQGSILVSKKHFQKHFISKSGSDFMLISSDKQDAQLVEDLDFAFKEFGWKTTTTRARLAAFNSVENTYLSIFFLMGAFAFLLGTVGLAVQVIGSLIERKKESSMLLALGIPVGSIVRIFCYEYLVLFFVGMFIGLISALVATLPTFLSGDLTVSLGFVLAVMIVLILSGVSWIFVSSLVLIRKTAQSVNLRNE